MGELLARVRAMLRRKTDFAPTNLTCGNLTLDRAGYELITPDHEKIHLASREFQMMEMLMTNPGRIISVDTFMDRIWAAGDADINVVWVYISNLRKKLTALEATCEIKASRGVGYSINETN
jgi:DNA-binding response OmpR family regulator